MEKIKEIVQNIFSSGSKTRLIVVSVISVIMVLSLMIGSTYSIFTSSTVDEKLNVYKTGSLDVTYTLSEDNVTMGSEVPVSDSDFPQLVPYRITVNNTGNVAYKFNLILNDTTATNKIDYQYIRVKVGKLEAKSLADCTDNIIKEGIIVPANDSAIIDIRVYLSEDVPNSEIGKSFYAKLTIDGVAIYNDNNDIDNSVLQAPSEIAVTFDSGNLIYGLSNTDSIESENMTYSISNGVVTVTGNAEDGYGFTTGRVYLEAGKEYTFSADTDKTWGTANSVGDGTVQAFLMLDGLYNNWYHMDSNNNYTFTPTITGTYWLRLDVNKTEETATFSNITVKELSSSELVYGSEYGELSTPTKTGYTFVGWYTEENGGTQITSNSKVTASGNQTLYARWSINSYNVYLIGRGGQISGGTALHNIVSNGSFENGSTGWSLGNASVTTDQKYTGSYALKLNSGVTAMSEQTMSITKPILNHKYYGRTMFLSSSDFTKSDDRFEWFYTDATGAQLVFANKDNQTTTWINKSSIKTQTSSSYLGYDWRIRNFIVNGSSDSYVDDVMIIDLTNDYGAGSEFTNLNVLDEIPYFEGEEYIDNKLVTYGETYGELPIPSRSGYAFDGWYTAISGGTRVTSSSTVSITSDQMLYAQWTLSELTVSFNANGGSVSTASKGVVYNGTYGDLPTPTRTGYTFNGWYTAASGGSQVTSSTSVTSTSNHTLYAQWSINSYSFNLNILNPDGSEPYSTGEAGTVQMSVNNGSYTTVYNEPVGSYPYGTVLRFKVFSPGVGRYLNSVTGATESNGIYSVTITGDTVVEFATAWHYYNFNLNVLNPDGSEPWSTGEAGSVQMSVNDSAYTTLYNEPAGSYTYGTVLKFKSFSPGTGRQLSSVTGATESNGVWSVTITGDTLVQFSTAWKSYTISFNANGGSVSTASKTVTYNSTYGTLPTPSRSNYSFDGWYTAASGGTQVTSSTTVSITSAQTLYAHWTGNAYYAIQNGKLVNCPNCTAWGQSFNDGATAGSEYGEISNGYGTFYGGAGHTGGVSEGRTWGANTGLMATNGCTTLTITALVNNYYGWSASLYIRDASGNVLCSQTGIEGSVASGTGTKTYTCNISGHSQVSASISAGHGEDTAEWMNIGFINVYIHN